MPAAIVEQSSAGAQRAAAPLRLPTVESPLARVLHLVNGEHFAGAERVQDLLARRLPEHGFEVVFAALKPGQFAEARKYQEAALVELPMRFRGDLRPATEIARLVQREGFTLVHAHTPRTLLIGRLAAAKAGVPLIYHVHSPTTRDSTRRIRNFVNARIERFGIRGARRAIAVSVAMARYARELGVPRDRVTVVANGVPAAGPLEPRATPTGPWTLGMVALFRPRKGLEVLLTALAQARAWQLPVRLRAIGRFETAAYEASVKALVERLGVAEHVEWVGFSDNVQAELERLDALVLPSLFGEGLPMVVLEAMAAGVPVIASDVEGIPEAIRDGREGALVRPGDPTALAGALIRLMTNELSWQQTRAAARARYEQDFSDRRMAAEVAKVYREVLKC